MQKSRFTELIRSFDLATFFNEMGWDNFKNDTPIAVNDDVFILKGIAEKRGFVILHCLPDADGKEPPVNIRKQIEGKIAKLHFEHLIIFTDKHKSRQVWQLTIKEENKPKQVRDITWYSHQDTEQLFQRLRNLMFTLDEEENITIVDVKARVSENFTQNTEQVTKRFYDQFKKQHKAFLDFIDGIDDHLPAKDNTNKQWYASLMLNRLMFCYFIQKKGFLDQNTSYLRDKLKECRKHEGDSNFYSFYRSFLLELFHDGLGSHPDKRKSKHPIDLGNIPYLNGGLFDVHELEDHFKKINIDDEAFEKIFEFFDKWNWHLDYREESSGKDINPDVIGYIFEKYINDRAAMGAYYTKEDITDYIGKNTIIPFLFDETERQYKKAFNQEGEIWQHFKNSGDTYIYDAVKYGVPKKGELFDDMPEDVKAGFMPELGQKVVEESTHPHLWEIRKTWNQRAPQEIGLPTEIYRELIERRKRYAEVKQKIESGEIKQINDFITYNLNIRQFAQDVLETTSDPELVKTFFKSIQKVTILDPTCGSGAFLFAALNILEPLYETCIQRMENFVADVENNNIPEYLPNDQVKSWQSIKHKDSWFRKQLAEIYSDKHPSLQYFIYKSIILNNLYGVDIMKEAVEIAKLRLFLKLVALVDPSPRKPNYGLEPLPDIDFNIRAGNSLVGFATEEELLKTIEKKEGLFAQEKLDEFKEEMAQLNQVYRHFQNAQLINNQGSDEFWQAKAELLKRLKNLNNNLNVYLATNYGITNLQKIIEIELKDETGKKVRKKVNQYEHWLNKHQPFHWFAEFYQIVAINGGFDVVIGNPPYLEVRQIEYDVVDFETREGNAVHAMCIERSLALTSEISTVSMIVPIALVCTQRMTIVQNLIEMNGDVWYSNFAWRPGKLFDQVNRALTIFCMVPSKNKNKSYSTGYLKWNAEHRDKLIPLLSYVPYLIKRDSFWHPKLSSQIEIEILKKHGNKKSGVPEFYAHTKNRVYYRTTGGLYWKVFTSFPPKFYFNGKEGNSSRETSFSVAGQQNNTQIVGILSSNLFWWWYTLTSNLRDLNPSDINGFHFGKDLIDKRQVLELSEFLLKDLQDNSLMLRRYQKNKGETETQSFKISKSKPIIDQIDTVLAQHYGFTEEELDFIINYDIKYRMGKALFGEEENGEDTED